MMSNGTVMASSHMSSAPISTGVPTISYCRVKGPRSNDLDIQKTAVIVRDSTKAARFEVTEVFDSGTSDNDFFQATIGEAAGQNVGIPLHPIRAMVYDAVPVVVFNLGSSRSQKAGFYRNTLLPRIAEQLFKIITEKETNQFEMYQYQLFVAAFEIQDEILKDLLRPQNQSLQITLSMADGIHVEGLHYERAARFDQLIKLLDDALTIRTNHALPTGAGIDTSCCVVELVLRQQEHDAGVPSNTECKLLVIDVPSTDKLAQAPETLRRLEGPTLNQSLLALADVFRRLGNVQMAPVAPYRASKLTHYLQEIIGGNSIVVALTTISSGEPEVTKHTLDLLQTMSRAIHFPVGEAHQAQSLRGLLRKYRYLILCLEDELKGKVGASASPDESLLERLQEMEQQMLKAKLERNAAREDSAKIFQMMELLKAKYQNLIADKAGQANELIESEETRLNVSKALLEVKLEKSQMLEQFEREKHDLTTQLLAAKNEIFDLESQLYQARTQQSTSDLRVQQLSSEVGQLSDELHALRGAHIEAKEQLRREEERNAELGAELLTVVNQRDILQRENREATTKLDFSRAMLANLEQELSTLRAAKEQLQSIVQAQLAELDIARTDKLKVELELQRANVTFEQNKLSIEKSAADYIRDRDELIAQLRRAAEEESRRRRTEQEQFMAQLQNADTRQKEDKRKQRDVQRELDRLSKENSTISHALAEAREQLAGITSQYRSRLAQELQLPAEAAAQDSQHQQNGSSAFSDLVSSYSQRETRLLQTVATQETSLREAVRRNAALFDQYQKVVDIVSDVAPALLPRTILQNEDDLLPEGTVTVSQVQEQLLDAKSQLKNVQLELANQQEKAVQVVQALRSYSTKLEKESVELQVALHRTRSQLQAALTGAKQAKSQVPVELVKQRVQALQAENEELKLRLSSDRTSEASLSLTQENTSLRETIKLLQNDANTGVLHQLRQAEDRCAYLLSRNAGLDEQLRRYESYVRSLMRKQQKPVAGNVEVLGAFESDLAPKGFLPVPPEGSASPSNNVVQKRTPRGHDDMQRGISASDLKRLVTPPGISRRNAALSSPETTGRNGELSIEEPALTLPEITDATAFRRTNPII